MSFRRRILITALLLCHLLPAAGLVTSRLHGQQEAPPPPPETRPEARLRGLDRARPGEEVTIRARQQEKVGDIFILRGEVEILFRDFVLRADHITYDSASGDVEATGDVVLEGGPNDERVSARRAQYNVRSQTGRFHDVVATTGARILGDRVVLTSAHPFAFTGRLVEKTSPERYVVHSGSITSCAVPNPEWTFSAGRVTVDVGENARLYHGTFRILGVPLFYVPYLSHPVDRLGRNTGFLLPTIGTSSRRGTTLGSSFYWAINRSMDATIGAEYFSARGWAQHGQFRARPTHDSTLTATFFGVSDRRAPEEDQGGQDVRLQAEGLLPYDVRGVADVNYLSRFIFRLAYMEAFSEAVNSEVKSRAFLSRTRDGYFVNLAGSRYQNFQSPAPGDVITILRVPGLEFATVDAALGATPLRWSLDAALEGISRSEPGFVTSPLVGRFDLNPRVALPLVGGGWSLRPEFGLHQTMYTERRLPDLGQGIPVSDALHRTAFETSVEMRPPALGRIFEQGVAGWSLKHTIEPRFVYRYVSGVDNFQSIIRFDARDILSDTNELGYYVVQRLFARRQGASAEECPPPAEEEKNGDHRARGMDLIPHDGIHSALGAAPPARCLPQGSREVVRWEVGQKYFFDPGFGGALVAGRRNVFTTTAEFTGIAFLTEPRRLSPIISRLRIRSSARTDVQWNLDYDLRHSRINTSTALLNYQLGHFVLGGSHAYLQAPGEILLTAPATGPTPDRFNQFRVLAGYGHPGKPGFSSSVNVGVDANLAFLQYSAVQGTYNWDCIGFTVEYRRWALGAVRNENQFRFALSLANIGTFGNLRRQERLF